VAGMSWQRRERQTERERRAAYAVATERDADTCQRCLRNCGPVQRDHRQNRDPFNTTAANLQCLGLLCHKWKTEHPHEAYVTGYAVPSWARPDEYPAGRWFPTPYGTVERGWALYDDAGGVRRIPDTEAKLRMSGEWPGVSIHDDREAS